MNAVLRKVRPLLLGLACVLAGCSAMRVESRAAPNANLSAFHTYTVKAANDALTARPDLESVIRSEIASQLSGKGLAPAKDVANAEVTAEYRVTVKTEDVAMQKPKPAGQRTDTGADEWTAQFRVGTLTISLVPGKTQAPVWSGAAEAELNGKATPEQARHAVQAIFKRYGK